MNFSWFILEQYEQVGSYQLKHTGTNVPTRPVAELGFSFGGDRGEPIDNILYLLNYYNYLNINLYFMDFLKYLNKNLQFENNKDHYNESKLLQEINLPLF